MNSEFPRLIALLRKEKGLNQKNAAAALGVSQALLSHYENGRRECGLDLLIRTADYFGVTTDYLLGRNSNRDIAISTPEMTDNASEDKNFKGSTYAVMHKKLLLNSISLLFDLMQDIEYKDYANNAGHYISTAVYKTFRYFYSRNNSNPKDIFSIQDGYFPESISCDMMISELSLKNIEIKSEIPYITYDKLKEINSQGATSLLNVIRNVETKSIMKK